MASNRRVGYHSFLGLVIIVGLVAAVLGCLFGGLAGGAYGLEFKGPAAVRDRIDYTVLEAGLWLGAIDGLLVGLAWCWVMVTRAVRQPTANLIGAGAWNGLIFGVLATLILHAELALTIELVTFGRLDTSALLIVGGGLGCGIVVGLIVGGLFGRSCRRVVRGVGATAGNPP